MKQAVIFDLDGTLLNTLGDLRAATNHALAVRGLAPRSMDEIRRFVGNGIRLLICRAMPEGTSDAEIDAALEDFKAYYAAHIHDRTVPYDGIPQLLTALRKRGMKVAVLSNKIDSASQELIAYFPGKADVVFGEHVKVLPQAGSDILPDGDAAADAAGAGTLCWRFGNRYADGKKCRTVCCRRDMGLSQPRGANGKWRGCPGRQPGTDSPDRRFQIVNRANACRRGLSGKLRRFFM